MKIEFAISSSVNRLAVNILEIPDLYQLMIVSRFASRYGLECIVSLGDQKAIPGSRSDEVFRGTIYLPLSNDLSSDNGFGREYQFWKRAITFIYPYMENEFTKAEKTVIAEQKQNQEQYRQYSALVRNSFYWPAMMTGIDLNPDLDSSQKLRSI